jgi:hypothetical protein
MIVVLARRRAADRDSFDAFVMDATTGRRNLTNTEVHRIVARYGAWQLGIEEHGAGKGR